MKTKHQGWGWMLAVDFFFAGMGGGMLVIAGIIELFIGGGNTSLLGNILGPLFMCVGCGFLVLELGRPLQAWRVFMNPKAILTIGAWIMSIAIVSGFIYASFGIASDAIFWKDWTFFRQFFALVNIVTGLVVATYPGVLLGRHKGRPFWVGPGIMALFLLSSMVTGAAAHLFSGFLVSAPVSQEVLNNLPGLVAAMLFLQVVLWCGYIWIKLTGTTEAEAASAKRWLNGDLADGFKFLFLLMGTVLPLVMVLIPTILTQGIGSLLVLLGGVSMRMLVVRSGEDRTWLPGEQKYRARLPLGCEDFMKKVWDNK